MSNNFNKIPDEIHRNILDHLSRPDQGRFSRIEKKNHKQTSAHMLESLSQLEKMPSVIFDAIIKDFSPKELCSLNMSKKISSMKLPALVKSLSRDDYSETIDRYVELFSGEDELELILAHMTRSELIDYIFELKVGYDGSVVPSHPEHAVKKWLKAKTLKEICKIVSVIDDEEDAWH
jgi:hypothetical protein